MVSGIITDIQRYSTHEGPGIRTTVFLKGCQLNCQWCHNPETIQSERQLMYFEERCIGCKKCEEVCPNKVHGFINGMHTIDFKKCSKCGACVEACWNDALVFSGKTMTSKEVFDEILEDKDFYGNNGGVTFSGGEPLLQLDFIIELLEFCKNHDINTAIETNLYHSHDKLEKILPLLDLLICDIKSMNSAVHSKYTGVGNEKILANIKFVDEKGTRLIIRTPLIQGINDSVEDARQMGSYLSKIKHLEYYEILPYHSLGISKSRALGEKGFLFTQPSSQIIEDYINIVKSFKIKVFKGGEH